MTIKNPNKIIIKEKYAEIIINSPRYGIKKALIDLDDVNLIKKLNYCWFIRWDGWNFYISAFNSKDVKTRKMVHLHRIIMNCPDGLVIDHINHNTLDNRKCNLRNCEQKINVRNQIKLRKDNKSGYRYIYWHKRDQKWIVQIFHKELFRTENLQQAIEYRDKYIKELYK